MPTFSGFWKYRKMLVCISNRVQFKKYTQVNLLHYIKSCSCKMPKCKKLCSYTKPSKIFVWTTIAKSICIKIKGLHIKKVNIATKNVQVLNFVKIEKQFHIEKIRIFFSEKSNWHRVHNVYSAYTYRQSICYQKQKIENILSVVLFLQLLQKSQHAIFDMATYLTKYFKVSFFTNETFFLSVLYFWKLLSFKTYK